MYRIKNLMPLFKRSVSLLLLCLPFFTVASPPGEDQLILIKNGKISLLKAFNLVQQQTDYVFAYDESEIKISKKLKVNEGSQLLSKLLDDISGQTGLMFTLKQKTILVLKKNVQRIAEVGIPVSAIPISGTVRDQNGTPLSGATVVEKNTGKSVVTDANGNFSIEADPAAVLVISYVGYTTQEVQVNSRNVIEVTLLVATSSLTEVVVVGYQTVRRTDLTGSVSTVKVDEVSKLPVGTVEQALQGKSSGVRITQATGQPGEGVAVRIRGVGTINDNSPLYIVDGVPTKDGINFISPADIESISVLKDAASAAIYGARASNGVVIITTKAGKRGKTQFNFSSYAGVQTHGKLIKMANASQYAEVYNEAVDNDNLGVTNPVLLREKIPAGLSPYNTNWLNEIFQNGIIQSHQVSVRGGTDKVLYYLSGNYFQQDGIILNSAYERYSLLSKLNLDLTSKLSAGNNINLSYSKKKIIGSSGDGYGGNGGSVVRYALFRTPFIPVYDSIGKYSDLPAYPAFFGDGYNPVALAEKTDNKETEYRVFGNLFLNYKILRNLKFKTDLGVDAVITDAKRFDENYGTNFRINNPNRLSVSSRTNTNIIWNNTLNYTKVFNSIHNFSALAGTEAISQKSNSHGAGDRGFPDQSPRFRYIGYGNNLPGSLSSFESIGESSLFSIFGNATYAYRNTYLLSASIRRDGSSKFGPENKYGTFYSIAGGWNIHNTKFIEDKFSFFSKLKLRASYGTLGNQSIPDYAYISIIGNLYNYPFGQQQTANPGSTIATLGNPGVKWESSSQINTGIDMGIWNDKLTMSIDYFIKNTTDMLIPIPFPLMGGSANAPFQNAGEVRNNGLEVDLNYINHEHALKFDVNLNFSLLSNKIISLSNGQPIPGGRIDNNYNATLTTVGQPIGSFYLLEMDGIFQNEAEVFASAFQGLGIKPGDVKYKDQNEDGTIDEKDRKFLGSAIPKYFFGSTMNFAYKNFDLSAFFQGQAGNKIYSQVNMDIEGFYRAFNITERVYEERWRGEGTSNTMPRVSFKAASNNKFPSSRFLEDGDYVRLKNLQIGYTIPEKLLSKAGIKSLRVYVTGQNLLTWTKYTGLDPEMHISDNVKADQFRGDVGAGIDWGTYPSARSYIIGVNLNF